MTGSILVDLLVLIGILAIVITAGWYVLSQVALPDPVRKIVLIVFVLIAAIIGIILLMQFSGRGRLVLSAPLPALAASPIDSA